MTEHLLQSARGALALTRGARDIHEAHQLARRRHSERGIEAALRVQRTARRGKIPRFCQTLPLGRPGRRGRHERRGRVRQWLHGGGRFYPGCAGMGTPARGFSQLPSGCDPHS